MSAKGSLFAPSKSHSEDKSVSVDRKTGMTTNGEKIEINWIHLGMLTITPLLGFIGLATTKLVFPTFVLAILMYLWTGMGITAGYHRLWSHRAYKAHWAVRMFLMLGGAGAFEGSAKWWCRNHRAHHRYTDTEKDPYNATRGFWYSHLGWMLQKQNAHKIGFADISDLNKDPMILWQHKFYPFISIGVGLVLPTMLAGLVWGDYWGGYFYAGIWKMVGVHHATFFVNSLAHTWGNKTFSDLHTAFDSVVTAVLTLGEGYHNYHHEFPQDYRNGIKPYHYDPTKWLIGFWSFFGLAYDLKFITDEEIAKARVQMKQRQVDRESAQFQFGKHFDQLPELSWNDIRRRNAAGDNLIVIEGVVHDVKTFVHEHPGGRQTLLNFIGTDATGLFVGADGSHSHSKQARIFLNAMRMGLLKETDRGA